MNESKMIYEGVILRNEYFKTELKMLGFEHSSELKRPLNTDKGYHVLGRVGSFLEKYRNPVKAAISRPKEREKILGDLSEQVKNENLYMQNQDELISRIRSLYPDFALNMREKVSKEDFEIYEKMVKETGELIKDLTVGSKKRNLTKISYIEEQDIISKLIDSQEFAKACNVEDKFMTQEFEKFRTIVKEKGFEDEAVRNTTPCVILAELVREAETIERKKEKYMSNFEKYDKFLEGLNGKIEIRTKVNHKKEKEEKEYGE